MQTAHFTLEAEYAAVVYWFMNISLLGTGFYYFSLYCCFLNEIKNHIPDLEIYLLLCCCCYTVFKKFSSNYENTMKSVKK